jgi:hypothetical protein
MRQDAAEMAAGYAHHLDDAIAEARAIISAFHPATVRELGFEASLRSSVAPFPAARSIRLRVRSAVDDRALAGTLLLPVAQELVVNAVKHADPTAIEVLVTNEVGTVVLEVNDDGIGIDTATRSDGGRHSHASFSGPPSRSPRAPDWTFEWPSGRLFDFPKSVQTDPACHREIPAIPHYRAALGTRRSANGPELNARGHSLDVCSITPSTHPP